MVGILKVRYTQSGAPVTTLNIATDESYTDRDGNRTERTEWHRVVVFQRAAETCAQYLSKGSLVYVEGKLQTRKWQDQNGQDRYSTEIKADRVQFLDRKGDRGGMEDGGMEEPAPRRAAPSGGSRGGQDSSAALLCASSPIWMKTLARPSLPRPAIWTIFRSEGGVCGMRGESPLLSAMCVSAKGEIRKADGGRIPSARLW